MLTSRSTRNIQGKRTRHREKTGGKPKNWVMQVLLSSTFTVLSRSVQKVRRSLPRDPSQRKIVINTLFEEQFLCSPRKKRLISTWTNIERPTKSGRSCILTDALREKLDDYLCQNTISFTLPGQNNQVYIGKDENRESIFESKKYILWTLDELASIIKDEEDKELSQLKFSTIYRYIRSRRQYIINSKIPEVDCICPLCETVKLMCEDVNKSCETSNIPKKCHKLLEKIACKNLTQDCTNGTCEECPTLDLDFLINIERIPYYHWVKKQHYEKQLTEMIGLEMKTKLNEMFATIKLHFCQKWEQSKMYRKNIAELADHEMLIHVDYSEL